MFKGLRLIITAMLLSVVAGFYGNLGLRIILNDPIMALYGFAGVPITNIVVFAFFEKAKKAEVKKDAFTWKLSHTPLLKYAVLAFLWSFQLCLFALLFSDIETYLTFSWFLATILSSFMSVGLISLGRRS